MSEQQVNVLLAQIVAAQQQIATAELDPDVIMQLIAERSEDLTAADGAVVELLEDDHMVYRAASGTAAPFLHTRLRADGSLSGLCVRTGELLESVDTEVDDRVDREACRRIGVRSMVLVPLRRGRRIAGVLKVLSRRAAAFNQEQINTLQLMAGLLGAALANAQEFAQIRAAEASSRGAHEAAERRFLTFMSHAPAVASVKDAAGRYVFVNERFAAQIGRRMHEIIGCTTEEVLDAEVASVVRNHDGRVLAQGTPVAFEVKFTTTDGPRHWLVSKFPVHEHDATRYIGGLALDVTERMEAMRSRDETLAMLDTLLNSAPFGLAFLDRQLCFLKINDVLASLLGERAQSYVNRPLGELPVLESQIGAACHELLAGGASVKTVEWSTVHAETNAARDLVVRCYPVWSPAGTIQGIGVIVTDVTEERLLERQYRQAQKLEAIGRLAGGVAHDFNNLLTVIASYSAVLLEEVEPGDPQREYAEEIQAAGERASALTRQLLAFSRQQVLQPRILDLNEIVENMRKMLGRLIGEDVELVKSPGKELWRVRTDATQIEQTLLNLVVNARDAMPSGGRVSIETKNVQLEDEYAATHADVQPGRYVLLAVSDTGMGMTPEIQARIFDPFFTTKEPGRGTGLGLATVFGIVKQSGGFVTVYSEPDRGSTFKVYLPAAGEDAVPQAAVSTAEALPVVAQATVLVAEDDSAVRGVIERVLRAAGYTILITGNGEEAAAVARTYAGEIDLLVTDVVMPGMGGPQLARTMAEIRPGLPVLFLSGYTEDAAVRYGEVRGDAHFLQKPFTPRQLLARIGQVIALARPQRI